MMTPIFVFGKTLKADAFAGIDTVLVHLVTPTIFIIFTYFARKYPKRKNSEAAIKYGKDFVIAFIVPLTYFTYLVVINFIPLPLTMLKDMYKNQFIDAYHNQQYFSDTKFYISVYSILTNYNHNCHIPIWLGSQFYFFNIDAPGAWTYDNEGSLLRLLSVPVALGFYFLEFVLFAYWNNRAIVDKYLPSLSRTDGYDLQTKNVLTKRNSSK
ncbi:MAG: hypothetical protein LBL60_00465 [Mycoplasmataceae bacterium]|nr:hypothetical protein [Mycoplasmataceae bacterium]